MYLSEPVILSSPEEQTTSMTPYQPPGLAGASQVIEYCCKGCWGHANESLREEMQRCALLLAHWDLPVADIPLPN